MLSGLISGFGESKKSDADLDGQPKSSTGVLLSDLKSETVSCIRLRRADSP